MRLIIIYGTIDPEKVGGVSSFFVVDTIDDIKDVSVMMLAYQSRMEREGHIVLSLNWSDITEEQSVKKFINGQ